MWFVDVITWKSCVFDDAQDISNSTYSFNDNKCIDKLAKSECIDNGGRCNIDIDGYYIETAINVVYGIIWYQWAKRMLIFLQELPISDWHVLSKEYLDDDLKDRKAEELRELKD
jgi:MFS transporter, PAT family, solute carrier family 33 (acetyl-CoA transportor), member 1